MQVLIVYESVFGVTHAVADAVAEGFRTAGPATQVAVVAVADVDADQVASADLLVVGGPTHMRGMSSSRTRHWGAEGERKSAADRGEEPHLEPGAEGEGLREWFDALPRAADGRRAAAFDTRGGQRMAGGATHAIVKRLRKHGYDVVAEEGFVVEGDPVGLRDGEVERAREWGAELQRRAEPAPA